MQIKGWVAGAGKGIVGQTADDVVAGRVQARRRLRQLQFVGALLQAIDVRTAKQNLDVALLGLLAIEGIEIARETSRVIVQDLAHRDVIVVN